MIPSCRTGAEGALSPHLRVEPEQCVWRQGTRPRGELLLVRRGILRLQRVTPSGERRIVGLAGRGMLLGVEAWLGEAHADDLIACTPVDLHRVLCRDAEHALMARPRRYRRLLRHWHHDLSEAQHWAAELLQGPARQRTLGLLRRLMRLSRRPGHDATVWLPRRLDMGAMLGLTEETVSRQISALRREGVLVPLGTRTMQVRADRLAHALDQRPF